MAEDFDNGDYGDDDDDYYGDYDYDHQYGSEYGYEHFRDEEYGGHADFGQFARSCGLAQGLEPRVSGNAGDDGGLSDGAGEDSQDDMPPEGNEVWQRRRHDVHLGGINYAAYSDRPDREQAYVDNFASASLLRRVLQYGPQLDRARFFFFSPNSGDMNAFTINMGSGAVTFFNERGSLLFADGYSIVGVPPDPFATPWRFPLARVFVQDLLFFCSIELNPQDFNTLRNFCAPFQSDSTAWESRNVIGDQVLWQRDALAVRMSKKEAAWNCRGVPASADLF